MKQNVYFVSGIDTDAGKSYATGYLAREWNKNGKRTITQKFIITEIKMGHSKATTLMVVTKREAMKKVRCRIVKAIVLTVH